MSRMPRAEAIDRAWRALGPGVEPLSNPDGGPLSRTVKLILLPLVLRPSTHRELAASVLAPGEALLVEHLVAGHREELFAAAQWFLLLVRRSLTWEPAGQISRDSCYPKAFELGVSHGLPVPGQADVVVQEAMGELALARGEWTPAALRRVLNDAGVESRLRADLELGWARGPAATEVSQDALDKECAAFLNTFVPGCALDGEARAVAEQAWVSIIGARFGNDTGWCVRADRWPVKLPGPGRARRLGLTENEVPVQPLLEKRSGSEGARPWDRSIAERVLGILKHSTDRTVLPDLADLLAEEVERACAPWELLEEQSRAVLLLGAVLATSLAEEHSAHATSAYNIVEGMRRRESWLSWAKRQPAVLSYDDGASQPIESSPTELTTLAAELSDPIAPYLRRLWVRLHGAEARSAVPVDVSEIQSLLVGVFRSVLLDGRSRIRAALTRLQEEQS